MRNSLKSALRKLAIFVVRRKRNNDRHERQIADFRSAISVIMSALKIDKYTLTVDGESSTIELIPAYERTTITANTDVIECLNRNGLGRFIKTTKVAPYVKVESKN